MSDRPLAFVPLSGDDLPMLRRWLSEPHVSPWFFGGSVDEAFVRAKYQPVVDQASSKRGFVIEVDRAPAGYVETYRGEDHESWFESFRVPPGGTAGVDLFIAAEHVGRGLGIEVIRRFTADVVFAQVDLVRAVAGPDVRNERSVAAFERAGYVRLREVHVAGDAAPAVVMQAEAPTERALPRGRSSMVP